MKTIFRAFVIFLCPVLLLPNYASALVSEARPSVPYFDQVLFLQKKLIENNKVVGASLAFADPRHSEDLCLNRMDVFGGLEKFRDIPENNWVLTDFELRSVLIAEGFAGDADVSWVKACPDVDTCLAWGEERRQDPKEVERRTKVPRPKSTAKANLEDISQRLKIGRELVKAARCRGCHNIEGSGPNYAPSLTWKRIKYEKNWLENYLKAPFRMRPAMDNLMMLNYTSQNAKPSMQQVELEVVADYLEQSAIASAPDSDQRKELWEDYDCFSCHVKIYKSKPLEFHPTPVPEETAEVLKSSKTMSLCLGCHAFGDMQIAGQVSSGSANAFAPDLLLAFEKLNLDFLANYLINPTHLTPLSQMPNLGLNNDQIIEIRNLVEQIKKMIDSGDIRPIHIYYELEKENR